MNGQHPPIRIHSPPRLHRVCFPVRWGKSMSRVGVSHTRLPRISSLDPESSQVHGCERERERECAMPTLHSPRAQGSEHREGRTHERGCSPVRQVRDPVSCSPLSRSCEHEPSRSSRSLPWITVDPCLQLRKFLFCGARWPKCAGPMSPIRVQFDSTGFLG